MCNYVFFGGERFGGEGGESSWGNSALNKVKRVSLAFNIQVSLQISTRWKYNKELFSNFFCVILFLIILSFMIT